MPVDITIAELDKTLSEAGQFSVLEWLLNNNLLHYKQYEAWRKGETAYVDTVVNLNESELKNLLSRVRTLATSLKLVAEPQDYFCWEGEQKPLRFSMDSTLNLSLGLTWKRPEDVPQLDLFMDGSVVICESQLHLDLASRNYSAATNALKKLTDLNPSHPGLGKYLDLINYGKHTEESPTISGDALEAELNGLLYEVVPLAKETLKVQARDYLAASWRRIASNLNKVSCDQNWRLHPGFALSQIPDWAGVEDSLKNSLNNSSALYNSPDLMVLFATALFFSAEPNVGFLVWGQIAERYPAYIEVNIANRNLELTELWDSFLDMDEQWPSEWFLSYMLIRKPGLVHLLARLPSADGPAIRLQVSEATVALVNAKIKEEDQKAFRTQLNSIAPAVLRYFMNKRDWYSR